MLSSFLPVCTNYLPHLTPRMLIYVCWHGWLTNQSQKLVNRVGEGSDRRVHIEMAFRKGIIFGEHPSVIFARSSIKIWNSWCWMIKWFHGFYFPLGCGSKQQQAFLQIAWWGLVGYHSCLCGQILGTQSPRIFMEFLDFPDNLTKRQFF